MKSISALQWKGWVYVVAISVTIAFSSPCFLFAFTWNSLETADTLFLCGLWAESVLLRDKNPWLCYSFDYSFCIRVNLSSLLLPTSFSVWEQFRCSPQRYKKTEKMSRRKENQPNLWSSSKVAMVIFFLLALEMRENRELAHFFTDVLEKESLPLT